MFNVMYISILLIQIFSFRGVSKHGKEKSKEEDCEEESRKKIY